MILFWILLAVIIFAFLADWWFSSDFYGYCEWCNAPLYSERAQIFHNRAKCCK